jgi:ribonuclease P protein subunit RPR2
LLVDDDAAFRALLRTTFEAVDVEVDEAGDAAAAQERIAAARPDAIVMDVYMPGLDGTALCALLKAAPRTRDIPVVLLTGSDLATEATAQEVGADALLLKPFSPLELLAVVERVAAGLHATPFRATSKRQPDEQLLLYARDLRHLLELERGQRRLLQNAYHETVTALAGALESKDHGTGAHSQRVHRYAIELAQVTAPDVCEDDSVAYGFMLHDVGKIGIPDRILQKPGPLTSTERRLMETHTLLGEQLLRGVSFLRGSGLEVVRSHHERWDGRGYPDGRAGTDVPAAARIFAVADALDAMTSDRPYRRSMSWAAAARELEQQSGRQFDPAVVDAFRARERSLRRIRRELDESALVA